jgi:spermidine synthase
MGGHVTKVSYMACLFGSASLLFLVEPMAARMLLPLVGGAAGVWTTALLFFQALLLAGYAYAHFVATRLGRRTQVAVQVLLLGAAGLTLPIQVAGAGAPAPGSNPTPWLLTTLAVRLGLPFFCLATLSPLLQSWFARSGHARAGDPYFLYRASNLGSFGALLSYPAIVERVAGLGHQSRGWQLGYYLLLVGVALVGMRLWRNEVAPIAETATREPVPAATLARWVALATAPSLWMLAVTTYFTTQVRPIPLFWVIPLALYLLSFVLAFARRPLPLAALARVYPYIAVVLLALLILGGNRLPFLAAALLQFGAFFLAALLCHGRLAAERPAAQGLTAFYLALAVGGAAGGLIGAVIAPALLSDLYEFPLVIIATGLLLPRASGVGRRQLVREVGLAGAAAAVFIAAGGLLSLSGMTATLASTYLTAAATLSDVVRLLVVLPLPALGVVAFSRKPAGLAVMLGSIFILSRLPLGSQAAPLYQSRDFFGVHRVFATAGETMHVYENAGVVHGLQLQQPSLRDLPTSYYTAAGPAGDVLLHQPPDASIGVIGLGAGSLACFSRPGQAWTFYEIDPEVVKIARDPALFTFVRDCTPDARLVLGDGRLLVAAVPSRTFSLVVVDAFGGDAPPVHVMTREAIAMYLDRLRPGGLLLFNISNSYVDFRRVLAATGASLGLHAYDRVDAEVSAVDAARGKAASEWMVLAREEGDAGTIPGLPGWSRVQPSATGPVWTDDYSNLLGVLRLF